MASSYSLNWAQLYWMLTYLLSQPAPVGLSFNHNPEAPVSTLLAAARDFDSFLKLFLHSAFPSYASNDLHVAGESFAGHYIPYYTAHVLRAQEHAPKEEKINVTSVIIGNGDIDPYMAITGVYDMLCTAEIDLGWKGENITLPYLKGKEDECDSMAAAVDTCEELGRLCRAVRDQEGETGRALCKGLFCSRLTHWLVFILGRVE